MKSKQTHNTVQLTIRGVPSLVKSLLLKRAQSENRSLNSVLVEALNLSAGLSDQDKKYTDLDGFFGSWIDDPDFDEAIASQNQIDESLWQ